MIEKDFYKDVNLCISDTGPDLERVWDQLIHHFESRITDVVKRLTRQNREADIDNIIGEIYLSLLMTKFPKFTSNHGLGRYILTISHNVTMDAVRKQSTLTKGKRFDRVAVDLESLLDQGSLDFLDIEYLSDLLFSSLGLLGEDLDETYILLRCIIDPELKNKDVGFLLKKKTRDPDLGLSVRAVKERKYDLRLRIASVFPTREALLDFLHEHKIAQLDGSFRDLND